MPLRGTLSCAFGAALLQGPTRGGLSHLGFHAAYRIVFCSVVMLTRSRLYATIVRRVRPWRRAYLPRAVSHKLSYRYDELCLFEALYPAPLARPFSKGLLAGAVSHRLSCRYGELCLFEALYPAPLARPFSKGLLARDYLTFAFMPPVGSYLALLSC